MKRHVKSLLSFSIILVLVFSINNVSADITSEEENGKVTIDNNKFHIEIFGNEQVPKYSFRHADETESTKYIVQFKNMFEFIDKNSNGYFDENDTRDGQEETLSSLTMQLGEIVTSTEMVSFNITLTPSESTTMEFDKIIIHNKLTGENSTGLKFDFILEGFNFSLTETNAGLALGFQLSSTTSDKISKDEGFNTGDVSRISFGDIGWFDTSHTATDDNGELYVGMNTGTFGGSNFAYLAYEKFNGTLIHDPTLGVQANVGDSDSENTDEDNLGVRGESDASDSPLIGISIFISSTVVFTYLRKRD